MLGGKEDRKTTFEEWGTGNRGENGYGTSCPEATFSFQEVKRRKAFLSSALVDHSRIAGKWGHIRILGDDLLPASSSILPTIKISE